MECPVCLKEFDADRRQPFSMPCGHSICNYCLYCMGGPRERRCPLNHEQSTAEAFHPVQDDMEVLDVCSLSQTAPSERQEEKAAALDRVRQRGVLRLTNVFCHCDPAWALDVLRSATATLETLEMSGFREEHLLAAHAMPALRRLQLWCTRGALDAQPPSLPALPRSALKWLRAWTFPRATLASLLRAHSASLEVLWLFVGTPGGGQWPRGCDDLDALLGQCPNLSGVVLHRDFVSHSPSACPAQVSEVRRVLPAATVQCSVCDKVAWEDF